MAGRMYEWRAGSRFRVDPNEAGAELERLRKQNGGIRPQEVVDAARDDSSPLHGAFEWDDSVAAENYRREEARKLCRAIRVVVNRDGEQTTEPMLVHVAVRNVTPDGEEADQYYEAPSVLIKTQSLWESVIGQMARRAAEIQSSVKELRDFAKHHEGKAGALDKVDRAADRTRKAIEKAAAA